MCRLCGCSFLYMSSATPCPPPHECVYCPAPPSGWCRSAVSSPAPASSAPPQPYASPPTPVSDKEQAQGQDRPKPCVYKQRRDGEHLQFLLRSPLLLLLDLLLWQNHLLRFQMQARKALLQLSLFLSPVREKHAGHLHRLLESLEVINYSQNRTGNSCYEARLWTSTRTFIIILQVNSFKT